MFPAELAEPAEPGAVYSGVILRRQNELIISNDRRLSRKFGTHTLVTSHACDSPYSQPP
jgi:hypothetical protein